MSKLHRRQRRAAFTLMEVLLVMAILVIISSVATISYINIQKSSKRKAAKLQISTFEKAIELYRLNVDVLPTQLEDLINPPADQSLASKWQDGGPFLDKVTTIPKDPWGQDYVYTQQGDTFKISSAGPDGQQGSQDDVTNES